LAGRHAGNAVIAFTGRQRRDLTLERHFQPVMTDHALGHACATDQRAVIAQDHEAATLQIAEQLRRHAMVELEAFEFVVFQFAIEPQRMLRDRQQAEPMRRDTHAVHGMGVQGRIQVRAAFQQSGMDDQRATFDRLDVGIRQHVAVKIDLQQ
jgi:hypothetical protein